MKTITTHDLMKLDVTELKEIESVLWSNWERASRVLKVKKDLDEEE